MAKRSRKPKRSAEVVHATRGSEVQTSAASAWLTVLVQGLVIALGSLLACGGITIVLTVFNPGLALAVSWVLVPVRTTDVLRRRLADVLAALGEVLAALTGGRAELALHERRFEHALDAARQILPFKFRGAGDGPKRQDEAVGQGGTEQSLGRPLVPGSLELHRRGAGDVG